MTRLCQASARRARLPLQVAMISLGCAKNLVDAEIMLGSVLKCGMKVTSRAEDADVLVVNTCAFIDSAKEESIEAILEAHQQCGLKRRPNQKLIVSGCMSQRFANELRQSLPEVDAFIGLDQVGQLGEIIERVVAGIGDPGWFETSISASATPMLSTTLLHSGQLTFPITTHRASGLPQHIPLT